MATTIFDFDINKNAVIIHYPHLNPLGPAYPGERPSGCCVKFHDCFISASIFWPGFRVFKNSENFSKPFSTLKEAKQFVIDRINKKRSFL